MGDGAPTQSATDRLSEARQKEEEGLPFRELDGAKAWEQRKEEDEAFEKEISELRRRGPRRDPAELRVYRLMDDLDDKVGAEGAAQKVAPFMPVIMLVLKGGWYLSLFYLWLAGKVFQLWQVMPQSALKIAYGLSLCFFGGGYGVSIAAVEIFVAAGWRRAFYATLQLLDDARAVRHAVELDDYADDNRDGVADVDQIDSEALLRRKLTLAMATVKYPEETQMALATVWAAYVSMLATLQFRFARLTAFAVAVAGCLKFFVLKLVAMPFKRYMPKNTQQWIPVIVDSLVHFISLVLVWSLWQYVEAVVSGLRGGQLVMNVVIRLLNAQGWFPLKDEETVLDEAAGLLLALAGISFQFAFGFGLPFPFNIMLLPLDALEWWLRWNVTWGS